MQWAGNEPFYSTVQRVSHCNECLIGFPRLIVPYPSNSGKSFVAQRSEPVCMQTHVSFWEKVLITSVEKVSSKLFHVRVSVQVRVLVCVCE